MLAENLLTPEQLKMEPRIWQAHREVLRMLETDEVVHAHDVLDMAAASLRDAGFGQPVELIPEKARNRGFLMTTICNDTWCGTTCCIGGWVLLVAKKKVPGKFTPWWRHQRGDLSRITTTPGQHDLYYPPYDAAYETITVAQAAQALRNFLCTGDPQWDDVLEPEQRSGFARLMLDADHSPEIDRSPNECWVNSVRVYV